MSLLDLTKMEISKLTGRVIEDVHLVIAKNSVLGVDLESIAVLLGVPKQEIEEIQQTDEYRETRLLIAGEYAKTSADKDLTWDAIEAMSLSNLAKRVPREQDTDTLLRIASMANRATRRQTPKINDVLDPAHGGTRVALNLTKRMVTKINASGEQLQISEEQISVVNGTAVNPTFEDIDKLLGVSARPKLPDKIGYRAHGSEISLESLAREFDGD